MRHVVRPVVALGLTTAALLGCGVSGETSDHVRISGALYVDVIVDAPCAEQQGPGELSSVVLTFTDATGAGLGRGVSGPLEVQQLEPGRPGTEGWTNPGCRFFATYVATVTTAASYRVEFSAPPPKPGPAGSYFQGFHELEPQTVTHDELRANAFTWSFEVQPSYVVQ